MFLEPEFFGGAVHSGLVVYARVADERLESSGVRRDPIHHVAAIGAACRGHAARVHERIFCKHEVRSLHQVFVNFSAPVVRDLVGELLSVTRRSARVDHHGDVAGRGK